MCLILYKPKGVSIPEEAVLDKIWLRNNDGAGIVSWREGEPLVMVKGIMTKEELHKKLSEITDDTSCVIHWRKQSRGGFNKDLTHPFDYSQEGKFKRLLFHNGTITEISPKTPDSDSSCLAKMIQPLSNSSVEKILTHFNKIKSGRFVSVVQDENLAVSVNILGDEKSCEKYGCWLSNTEHETYTPSKTVQYGGHDYWEDNYRTKSRHNTHYASNNTPVPYKTTSGSSTTTGNVITSSRYLLTDARRRVMANNIATKALKFAAKDIETIDSEFQIKLNELIKEVKLLEFPDADLIELESSKEVNPLANYILTNAK